MRQRCPDVKRLFCIPGRGALLAVSMGLVVLVVACGRPSEEVPPTVTRIASPANAPVVEPTKTPAPTEAAGEATTEATVAETGSVVAEAATVQSTEASTSGGLVGDVQKGKQLSAQCVSCHSIDGSTVVGPTWKGLYGHEVTLTDGTKVTADDAYIAQSIRDPNSQVVEGFPPVMPPFAYLSDQDIADLIAYIKSLE